MRASVQRDDADVVDHLDKDHHVSWRLHDLVVVVVGPREHRRSDAVHDDASHAERLVLGGIGRTTHSLSRLRALRSSGPSFCAQGRKSSIRWIHDEGRPQVGRERPLAAVQPELSEVVVDVSGRSRYGLLGFGDGGALDGFGRFLRRIELLRDVFRPFQRDVRGVGPEALQIRLSIGCARRSPTSSSGLRRLCGGLSVGECRQPHGRADHRDNAHASKQSTAHGTLLVNRSPVRLILRLFLQCPARERLTPQLPPHAVQACVDCRNDLKCPNGDALEPPHRLPPTSSQPEQNTNRAYDWLKHTSNGSSHPQAVSQPARRGIHTPAATNRGHAPTAPLPPIPRFPTPRPPSRASL